MATHPDGAAIVNPPDQKERAKHYIVNNSIPDLFESLTAGLLHHRPEHAVDFVQDCLDQLQVDKQKSMRWNTFVDWVPPPGSRTASRAASRAVSSQGVRHLPNTEVSAHELDLQIKKKLVAPSETSSYGYQQETNVLKVFP